MTYARQFVQYHEERSLYSKNNTTKEGRMDVSYRHPEDQTAFLRQLL